MVRLLTIGLVVFVLAGCGGSRGKLVNPTQAQDALQDDTPIYIQTDDGYLRVGLDGSSRQFVTKGKSYPVSVSADSTVFVVSNPDTDLFVRDLRYTGGPREVAAYRGRLGAAAVSPDGKLVAATRHADFSTPQSTWSEQEDNSIDIISVETLDVLRTVEPTEKGWSYSSLWFSTNGLLYAGGQASDVIDPSTGIRKKAGDEKPPLIRLRNMPRECGGNAVRWKGWRGDEGLELVTPDGKVEHVVRVEGRERGFHDYLPTVDSFFFVPSCKHVVFEFYDAIYAVDVATRRVSKITDGYEVFLGPMPLEAPDWNPAKEVQLDRLDTRRVFVTAPEASVCPTREQAATNDCGNSVEDATRGYVRRRGETVTVVGEPEDGFYRAIRFTKLGTLPSWVDASKVASEPPPMVSSMADSRHEAWRVRADQLRVASKETVSQGRSPLEPVVFLVERNEKTWALRLPECAARADDDSLRYMLFHGCLLNADCEDLDYICDDPYCDEITFTLEPAEEFEHEGETYPSKQVVELVDRMGRFVETDVCDSE